MNDTPAPDHGTMSFWPTDDNGTPTAPPVTYPLAGPIEVVYDDVWEQQRAERAREQLADITTAFQSVGQAITTALAPAFANIYDAMKALMPPRPRRSAKAERARAKRAKLYQRRTARDLYAGCPGVDWREAAPMLRKSIASIAREGVPCHVEPCVPFTTARLAIEPIDIKRTP